MTEDMLARLAILAAAAKYDVSCSSSGASRRGEARSGWIGSARAAGICHSWAADGRCISLLKILMTNDCIYDCAYCVNRRSNDVPRASFTPREVAELTIGFYRRNYIEGLFLSSAVRRSPDDTMVDILRTLSLLRREYRFGGYIHAKIIPGASPELVDLAGALADRVSVNIELPSAESLSRLAPQKSAEAVFRPMRQIGERIAEGGRHALPGGTSVTAGATVPAVSSGKKSSAIVGRGSRPSPFAPAGQSTQMIVGATPETDLTVLRLSEGLYRKMRLKRVFYSAYVPVNPLPALPVPGTRPPLLREHRLYQADWLLRFYGFRAEEILESGAPNLDPSLDPKTAWALRNMDLFPLDVNRADYEMLLRAPGIGVVSARRILAARRARRLNWENLKKLGVVMKRAQYFLKWEGLGGRSREPSSEGLRDLLMDPESRQLLLPFEEIPSA